MRSCRFLLKVISLALLGCVSGYAQAQAVDTALATGAPPAGLSSCPSGHPQFKREFFKRTGEAWPLYAWTAEPFDPSRPTVLFFNGGPGQSSHGRDWVLPGWNVIFWDQRGVGCSKPETEAEYLNQASYSIEGTAEDARKVLDMYGVQQASLLAVSYGTAPATVFASLYPERVRAVVLEGTLFKGSRELHDLSQARQRLIRFFKGLPLDKQTRLREWSKIPGVTPAWFSRVGYYFLTLNDGLAKLEVFLDRLIEMGISDPTFFSNFGRRDFDDEPFGASSVVFAALACGELSQGEGGSTAGIAVTETGFDQVQDETSKEVCLKYGFQKVSEFDASLYPVHKKITYFQGVLDGATEAKQAVQHFKSVPQAGANLYLRIDGGHGPLLGEIMDPFSNRPDLQKRYLGYLIQALDGQDLGLTRENQIIWKLARKK